MKILGIESSCDETAVAIVEADKNSDGEFINKKLLANVICSQIEAHKQFGGVFPEVASRMHLDVIAPSLQLALLESGLSFGDIDYIAATCGPGLVGGLVIGAGFGKGLAYANNIPFVAVNHLTGHSIIPRFLYDELNFPYLILLASGGHSLLGVLKSPFEFERLGTTIDDSAGECFDKVARMIGLEYPGGPNIEKIAKKGDPLRFDFPIPLNNKGCDFSFSGLKTAVLTLCKKLGDLTEQDKCDVAASFQSTIAKIFIKKISNAIEQARYKYPDIKSFVFSGGVAANMYIADKIKDLAKKLNYDVFIPPLKMCTDNAVMIAWAAFEMLSIDQNINDIDTDLLDSNMFGQR